MKFRNDPFLLKCVVLLLLALFVLSGTGCASMSPGEKRTAWIVGGIVVASVIVSSEGSSPEQPLPCKPSIRGSGTDFDFYCRPQ